MAHRFLLPVVAASTLAIAACLLWARPAVSYPLGPIVVGTLGVAGLVVWAAHARAHRLDSEVGSPDDPAWRAEGEEPCARCSEGRSSYDATALFGPPREFSLLHTGTTWGPLVTTLASAADELWQRWNVPEGSHLPVELVGPVPETAFSLPKPGAPDPFPHHDTDLVFPDLGGPGPSLVSAPGLPEFDLGSLPRAAGDYGGGPGLSWIHLEALNPTPPHLRPAPTAATRLPLQMAPPVEIPHPTCASCDRALPGARGWDPCTNCQRPVCASCLLDSLWNHGQGWCVGCARHRHLNCT